MPGLLTRPLAVAAALFAALVATLVLFWMGVFALLARVWPLLPHAWSGAVALALILLAIASGLVIYYVLLRATLRALRMPRPLATGDALYLGAIPVLATIWVFAAFAIGSWLLR
jgi:hypothetical protein